MLMRVMTILREFEQSSCSVDRRAPLSRIVLRRPASCSYAGWRLSNKRKPMNDRRTTCIVGSLSGRRSRTRTAAPVRVSGLWAVGAI